MELLGVPAAALKAHGAVSAAVARAMVEGALANARADIAVAVTGIAGPTGGTAAKPVGLVHFAAQRRGRGPVLHDEVFPGDRASVRLATVGKALALLRGIL